MARTGRSQRQDRGSIPRGAANLLLTGDAHHSVEAETEPKGKILHQMHP